MKALVTGHQGFIGSQLFNKLKQDGHMVAGFDKGDMLMYPRVEVVYHLAANPKVIESVKNPSLAMENIKLTFDVLEWMRASFTRKIIFASSAISDEYKTPYSASKLACERLIEGYCHSYNIGGVSLRFFNIYGGEDRKDRFIPTLLEKAKTDENINIYGESGDFLHIDDCVDALIDSYKQIERGKHKVFKVSNEKTSLVDVAEKIKELTSSKSKITLAEGLKKCLK